MFYRLQLWTKYLRKYSLILAHQGKSLISIFQESFANIDKTLILGGRLGTRLSSFEIFLVFPNSLRS